MRCEGGAEAVAGDTADVGLEGEGGVQMIIKSPQSHSHLGLVANKG